MSMKNKIKALIIDDEKPARLLISKYLQAHSDIIIVGECDNGYEGAIEAKKTEADLIFLDIQMPKLNGFEMLELIDNPPPIIFSTAYDEFAIKAFEFGAADYLLKPYSQKRFNNAIERAKQKITNRTLASNQLNKVLNYVNDKPEIMKRIAVKMQNSIEIIQTKNIEHFEAQDDYVFIYTNTGERYIKNMTMSFLEKSLEPSEFVRVHRSNIIRVDRISRIEQWEKDSHIVILKSGVKVKVSRSGLKRLKEVLKM